MTARIASRCRWSTPPNTPGRRSLVESLGGVENLADHPLSDEPWVSARRCAELGIGWGSFGSRSRIEDPADVVEDLDPALGRD